MRKGVKATTSRPSIHNNNFVSVIKNAKNRQIHIGFNTSYNDSNELSIKIFTITYNVNNVNNLNKSLRKYSKKNLLRSILIINVILIIKQKRNVLSRNVRTNT